MEAEDLNEIKNIPVHTWLPVAKLSPSLLETLELEYLVDRRLVKMVQSWSSSHKGFIDVKLPVNEFRLRHRILEVYEKFYICTQSPIVSSIYAFYIGRCVCAGDNEAILVELSIEGLGKVQEVIANVKTKLSEITTIKKTKRIRLY